MRTRYNFSQAKRNPYATQLNKQIAIREPRGRYVRPVTEQLEVRGGLLSYKGTELRLNFRLNIDRFGNVTIDFDPIRSSSIEAWADHWRVWHELEESTARRIPFFALSGCTEDGIKIHTEYARLEKLGRTSTPSEHTLLPTGAASELNLEWPVPKDVLAREPVSITYLSRAQLGFPHEPVQSPLGELNVTATSRLDDYSDRFGVIVIEKAASLSLEDWAAACDELVGRILHILSLAQGRWLQWTSREIRVGGSLLARRLRPRELRADALASLFHFLNLKPVLDLAVGSYTRELIEQTGLDIALSWMLAPASHIEGRFLNQVIALEHLVEAFEPKVRTVIPREAFRKELRPKLDEAVRSLVETGELSAEQGEVFKGKINELNAPVFYDKVRQLLQHYQVPIHDLEGELQFVVVQCRNDVVHRGLLRRTGEDRVLLHRSVDVAEELLKRIVMAILGYQGQYISTLYNLDTYLFGEGRVEPLP